MINLKKIFETIPVPLSKELIQVIEQKTKIEKIPKGSLLVKGGQIAHRLYFLEKGTARTFYYHKGKDITSWIYRENLPFTAWSSFLERQPSFENIEILEDSTLLSFTKDTLDELYLQYPTFERFGRKMVEQQLSFLDAFYKGYMFMSAKERYDLLLTIFPDVTQRINLGHIASFLGISQETLSRIRSRK